MPTCPGWNLARLVEHVGQARRIAAYIVEHRLTEVSQPCRPAPRPDDEAGRRTWLTEGAARLGAAPRAADPRLFGDAALLEHWVCTASF